MFCHTAGKWDLAGQLGGTVPRQEVVHPVDGMLGDALQHVAQPGLGGDAIELGRADQAIHGGRPPAAAVGAGKQEIAPAQCYAAQRPLGGRVVDLDAAVVGVAGQGWPQRECVQDRRRQVRLARQRGTRARRSRSGGKGAHGRRTSLPARVPANPGQAATFDGTAGRRCLHDPLAAGAGQLGALGPAPVDPF